MDLTKNNIIDIEMKQFQIRPQMKNPKPCKRLHKASKAATTLASWDPKQCQKQAIRFPKSGIKEAT